MVGAWRKRRLKPQATTVERYDAPTVVFHWATAVLVAGLWIAGQTADYIPKGTLKSFVWSSHVAAGFLLAAVFVLRISWRLTSGTILPPIETGVLHWIAQATHLALYLLLSIVITLGIANAFIRGYDMYSIVVLPQIGDPGLKRAVTQWHGLAADALLVLAMFHASAALIHHYAWFDGLITRMSIGRTKPKIQSSKAVTLRPVHDRLHPNRTPIQEDHHD